MPVLCPEVMTCVVVGAIDGPGEHPASPNASTASPEMIITSNFLLIICLLVMYSNNYNEPQDKTGAKKSLKYYEFIKSCLS
jgi:hypothetical protein